MKIYLDAKGAVVGRIGSVACKELLKGKEVVIINAEKSIISGDRAEIRNNLHWWITLGGVGLKGPKVSRYPDRFMKRMIRGMLPSRDRSKGREAYDRLRCYIGNGDLSAEELKQVKTVANAVKKPIKYVVLGEIVKEI
ncbi:MAG: 50S ribosomal protein L13 [archaeon]